MSISSVIRYTRALDSTATDGSGKTGLAFGDVTAKYLAQGGTLTTLTTETITTLGTYQAPTDASHIRIKELSSSDPCKGVYEIHFHNTQTAESGKKLWLFLSATGAAFQPIEVDLIDVNGRLPAALTSDGNIKADALRVNGVATTSVTTINANLGTTAPNTAQTGDSFARITGTGAVTFASLTVSGTTTLTGAVSLGSTLGVTGTTTFAAVNTGAIGTGNVTITGTLSTSGTTTFNALTVSNALTISGATTFTGAITGSNASNNLRINGVVPGAAGGLFIAGTNAATTITTALTTTFTGDLTGSVASVSGNVGGNVAGSVGSVASGGITAASIAADAITAAKIADGAIDRATFAADTGLQTIRSNTATAGGSTSITLDASASAVDSFYVNCLILLTGGTGVGQSRFITAYTGSTKVATVAAWGTAPDNTTTFAILPFDSVPGATAPTASQVATAIFTDLLSGSDFSTSASFGKLVKDNLNATVGSRAAPTDIVSGGAITTSGGAVSSVTAVGTTTDLTNLPTIPANWITAAGIAADAIGASELAATAVAEIAAAILTTPGNLLVTDSSGRVTVGSLAAGSITSAVVATDAIDADALSSDAVAEIQSGLATSSALTTVGTNVSTLLSRLGAFTGSGVNTVLGLFKALLKSDATAPSDVGGTFDPATDSTQAIRDRGDAAWVTATGYSTLDAAGVRSAVGLTTNNLDTQIGTLATASALSTAAGNVSTILGQTGTTGVVVASGSKTGYKLASDGVDLIVIETGLNLRQAVAITAAAAAGVVSGAATTTVVIAGAGVGTTRISATVDSDGNRSAVTISPPT